MIFRLLYHLICLR